MRKLSNKKIAKGKQLIAKLSQLVRGEAVAQNINNNRIVINGKSFSISSTGNISINNGRVTIDGEPLDTDDILDRNITITIEGNIEGDLRVNSGSVDVTGNVEGDIKVDCGNVAVTGDVGGDVKVSCGNVSTL